MTASFIPTKRTTRQKPEWDKSITIKGLCPSCGHEGWCSFDRTRNWLLCRRDDANPNTFGWDFVKTTATGKMLFYKTSANDYQTADQADYSHVDLSARPDFAEQHSEEKEEPAPAGGTESGTTERPVELYNQVYTDFLAQLQVNKNHLKELTDPVGKRRLTRTEVAAMGVKSLPVDRRETAFILTKLTRKYGVEKLCSVPGFYADKFGRLGVNAKPGSLLIPAHDGHTFTGIEIATGLPGKKYIRLTSASEWMQAAGIAGPKGWQRASLYRPLSGVKQPDVIGICEGSIKSFIVAQRLGMPFVAVPGVSNWRLGAVEIALEQVGKGGQVIIFYDSDAATNPNVMQARNSLADGLALAGFKVEVATWTTEFKGIDDLLLAGGTYETNRHFLGLGGIPVNQVKNERFLSNISLSKKVTLFKGAKNTGKTEAVGRFLLNLRSDESVLSVGHRVALLFEQSRRWGLEFYQDYKGVTVDRKGLTKSNRLAICADSLTHLNSATGRTYIILDEVEQVLKHLTGSTIRKTRRGVLAMFEALLKLADHIIALDADLGGITYRYFERLLGAENIEVVVNEYVPEKAIPMIQYNSQNEITAALFEKLKAGIRPAVFTNNKAEAQRLERAISKDFPELKILCVHQDNSASPAIRQVIANLNLYAPNFDVLIASPSLGTGVDINVKHFTETFIIGNHHSTNHTDLLQHMARNRQPDLIHAYVAPGERYEPTDPAFWERQCIDKYYETGLQIEYSLETGERIANPFDVGYLKLWADIKAAEKASHNRLAANFFEQAAREGYQVQPVHQDQGGAFDIEKGNDNDAGEAAEAGKKRAAAALELEAERKESILAAPDITDKEADELAAKSYLPKPQRAKLEKHRINRFYNLPVDTRLVEIDNKGRTMGRLNEYMMFAGQIDTVERDRSTMDDRENMVPDARHYTLRKILRVEALAAAGVDFQKTFKPDQLAANGFIEWGLANKDRIYSVLGITVKSDFETRPVELLSALFHQLGVKLQSRSLGKRTDRTRLYSVDKKSARLMADLAAARLIGLQKHTGRLVELVA